MYILAHYSKFIFELLYHWWKICTHALYLYWVFIWLILLLLLFFCFFIFAFCTYFLLLFCTLKRWNEPFKFSQLDQSGSKFTQSRKWRRWRTHWPQLGLYGNRQAFGCTSTNSFTKRFLCIHWRQWRWFRCFSFSFTLTFFVVFVSLALLVICLFCCFCLQTFFPISKIQWGNGLYTIKVAFFWTFFC